MRSRPKRIADGEHFLSDDELVRVAHRNHGQLTLGLFSQTDDGEIGVRIAADDHSRIIFLSTHADGKFLRSGDDVVVRQNVSLLVQNRTGTGTFLRLHEAEEVASVRSRVNEDYAWTERAVNLDVVLFVSRRGWIGDSSRRRFSKCSLRRLKAVVNAVHNRDSSCRKESRNKSNQ